MRNPPVNSGFSSQTDSNEERRDVMKEMQKSPACSLSDDSFANYGSHVIQIGVRIILNEFTAVLRMSRLQFFFFFFFFFFFGGGGG